MIGEWLQGGWGWLVAGLVPVCLLGLAWCVRAVVVLRRQLRAVLERLEVLSSSSVEPSPVQHPPVEHPPVQHSPVEHPAAEHPAAEPPAGEPRGTTRAPSVDAAGPAVVEPVLVEPVDTPPGAWASTRPTGGQRSFSDTLLRETVVKGAALVYGVRHALRPEARNRMRFEMRQEVKRARRQRREDLKQARRDLRARQRAAMTEEDAA